VQAPQILKNWVSSTKLKTSWFSPGDFYKKKTEKLKQNIAKAHIGKKKSLDSILKSAEGHKNIKHMTNGIEGKLVKKEDIDLYISKGWIFKRITYKDKNK
jgi:hypothetical protein